jgi:hypothetical protein
VDKLAATFPRDHTVHVYAASMFPGDPAEVRSVALDAITEVRWRPRDTLVVPPAGVRSADERYAQAFRRLRDERHGASTG